MFNANHLSHSLKNTPAMENPLPPLAVPGQQLASTSTYLPGAGTHVHNGVICASISGPVFVEQLKSKTTKSVLSVLRSGLGNVGPNGSVLQEAQSSPTKKPKYNTLPAVDSIVLARVTRVQKRQVALSILVILDHLTASAGTATSAPFSDNDNIAAILTSAANLENQSTSDELRFQALIRKEDVRAVEKDRVVLEEMFRVGDVVRGSVISLGDQSFYYLTTARNDLGVVMARSESGNMMFPESRQAILGDVQETFSILCAHRTCAHLKPNKLLTVEGVSVACPISITIRRSSESSDGISRAKDEYHDASQFPKCDPNFATRKNKAILCHNFHRTLTHLRRQNPSINSVERDKIWLWGTQNATRTKFSHLAEILSGATSNPSKSTFID
ncbi:hypothetical protein UA08_06579 [Talaromyces atroroseus]|uniref:Exosome complex component CSL4 C-terminal domain-containing protein n=1 Tax=Talaromyces atroroseus TaxID=1441469 RepID=A0A225ARA9_TALAT|nr:hypothetical protein UA08_06579 [Talaromyces atroroseus]OKL58119.1 hypothetical protein UA08_06579 [Talaromyces atroroseus]